MYYYITHENKWKLTKGNEWHKDIKHDHEISSKTARKSMLLYSCAYMCKTNRRIHRVMGIRALMDETCPRSEIVNTGSERLQGATRAQCGEFKLCVNWRQIKSVTHRSSAVWRRRRRPIRLGLSFRLRRPDAPPTEYATYRVLTTVAERITRWCS